MSDRSAFTSIGSAERSSNEIAAFPPAPVAGPPDQRLKGAKIWSVMPYAYKRDGVRLLALR
jgi:hypothetical protein